MAILLPKTAVVRNKILIRRFVGHYTYNVIVRIEFPIRCINQVQIMLLFLIFIDNCHRFGLS